MTMVRTNLGEQLEQVWFRQIVERGPDAIVVVDEAGKIILVNHQTERLFEYDRDDLLGRTIEILIPEQYRTGHTLFRDQYFQDPKTREMGADIDLTGRRKNGSEFPVEISLSPLETDRGRFTAAAIRDATDRRKAQRQFRGLLEAAPDAMVMINASGVITLVNAQAEHLFGHARQDMIGRTVEMLIPERLRDAHQGHRSHYFVQPKTRGMGAGLELSGLRADGSEFPIEISLSPLDTEDGPVATAAVRDITERKVAERKLKKYAESLEASNVQLEQFAYVASHDLQAPLRNIVAFSQILQRKLRDRLDEDDIELFQLVDDCGRRMQSLIDGLLELSRVNQTPPRHKQVDLNTVLEHATMQLQSTLQDARAEVSYDQLPHILGDESLLTQLFQNLISNGIKFQPEGASPKVTISAEALPSGGYRVQVEDNGIGIDPKQIGRIFSVFKRLHSTEEYPGTGIGLAICQKIVELHRGKIWAESEPGHGSRFMVEFPENPED